MDVYEAMQTLRAVRRLRPDPVPEAVVRRLLAAATWAPSGGNAQPWRVVVVRERALLEALGALYADRWRGYAARHAAAVADASEAVQAAWRRTRGACDHLAAQFASTPALFVFCFAPALMAITDAAQDRPSVVGGASVYPAVQNLLLACRVEGLGCVLTTLLCEEEPRVRDLLAIPDGWYTAAAVPVGYPVGRGHGPLDRRPVEKMAFADRWGAPLR